jgi:hypothetical protein
MLASLVEIPEMIEGGAGGRKQNYISLFGAFGSGSYAHVEIVYNGHGDVFISEF